MKQINKKAILATVAIFGMMGATASAATFVNRDKLNKETSFGTFSMSNPWSVNGTSFGDWSTGPKFKAAGDDPSQTTEAQAYNVIPGPDGSNWFYTARYEEGEYFPNDEFPDYSEYRIKKYRYTFYDSAFEKVGEIYDEIIPEGDETMSVQVELGRFVTDNFFNTDSKYEVMVSIVMNTKRYKNNWRNMVYSIGGEKDENGYDKSIARIDGFHYNTFLRGSFAGEHEYYLAFTQSNELGNITIYKGAIDETGPVAILTYNVPDVNTPGSTEDDPCYLTKEFNGKPYFIFCKYEKSWLKNPSGMYGDESQNPNNNLMIDVFTLANPTDTKATQVSGTKIPVEIVENDEQLVWTMYSLGTLAGSDDIDMSVNGTPDAPAFLVKKNVAFAASYESPYESHLTFYNTKGEFIKELATGYDNLMILNSLPGKEPQALISTLDNSGYTFHAYDIYSGNIKFSISNVVGPNREMQFGSGYVYRVATKEGKIKYIFHIAPNILDVDQYGNDLVPVAWINEDGSLDEIHQINVGPDVWGSQVQLNSILLDPNLFDNDDEMEYVVMVKRGEDETQRKEETLIVDHNGDRYATFSSDEGKGTPRTFSILQNNGKNSLMVVYAAGNRYYVETYDLPFQKIQFSGVDGVVDSNDASGIYFDGSSVVAQGCKIEIYSANGVKVTEGLNAVSTSNIGKGVSIAVATDANGNRSTIKIVR